MRPTQKSGRFVKDVLKENVPCVNRESSRTWAVSLDNLIECGGSYGRIKKEQSPLTYSSLYKRHCKGHPVDNVLYVGFKKCVVFLGTQFYCYKIAQSSRRRAAEPQKYHTLLSAFYERVMETGQWSEPIISG
jgi:hypothetical protein